MLAKAEKDEVVCGIDGIRRKEGKRSTVDVFGDFDFGSEDREVRTLLKGYMDPISARVMHAGSF